MAFVQVQLIDVQQGRLQDPGLLLCCIYCMHVGGLLSQCTLHVQYVAEQPCKGQL
jgi:hypothetical protein